MDDVRFVQVHIWIGGRCTSVPVPLPPHCCDSSLTAVTPPPTAVPYSQSDPEATLEDLQKPGMDAEPNQVQLQ